MTDLRVAHRLLHHDGDERREAERSGGVHGAECWTQQVKAVMKELAQ